MNKDIVPTDTRYVPFTQHRWCCVPTCILMIMYKHSIPLISQELLGYYLGLVVPPDQKEYFWNVRISEERPSAGYGTRIGLPEFNPNKAFETLQIPLRFTERLIDTFHSLDDFKTYLREMEQNNKDIVLCFDVGALWDSDLHDGHACLLDRVINDNVRMVDPTWNSAIWEIVSIKKLYQAMQFHGVQNSAGCWEFEKINK